MSTLTPIPWQYRDFDVMKVWQWRTEHFDARISSGDNSFSWELGDLTTSPTGEPRVIAEGKTNDFNSAETALRETIGKSYAPRLGYHGYAGHLATTFTLATRESVNLADYAGQRVVVTVRLPSGGSQSYIGDAQVRHYELIITPPSGAPIKIQPAHIVSIRGEGGSVTKSNPASYTGMGRVYNGNPGPGCTGQAGFLPNTVDHTGAHCPVHEDHTADYLS